MYTPKIKGKSENQYRPSNLHRTETQNVSVLNLLLFFFSGLVPLHNACSYGHYEVTELLVKHGASVNVADLWKFTPLHEAAAKGKYEIVRLLLKVSKYFI